MAFWSYLINLRLFAETWRQWLFLFTSRRPNRYHQAVSWLFQALFFVKTEEIQKKLQQDTHAKLKHYGKQEKYLLHRKQQYKGRTPWSEKMFILLQTKFLNNQKLKPKPQDKILVNFIKQNWLCYSEREREIYLVKVRKVITNCPVFVKMQIMSWKRLYYHYKQIDICSSEHQFY